MIKKPLLKIGGLMLLIAVMSSCKKDAQPVAPTNPTSTEPKTSFSGVVDGRTLSLNESSMSSTYYSTDGDATKALLTTNTLSSAGDQLVFFIADVKAGTQTITKKLGTSSNPGVPGLRVNGTGTVSTTTQTYVKYRTTGKNTFYAISGAIDISITGNDITVKWDIKFLNSISGEFSSKGTYTVLNYTATVKAKSDIVDPTPVTVKPTIENMTPLSGAEGDTVTLTGVNYSATIADNILKFNGTDAKIISANTTKIKAIVPKQGVTGAVTLRVKNSDILTGPTFTYILPAKITSFAPAVTKIGDTVVIKGSNFSTTKADNVVKIKNVAATVIAASATQISAVVPTGAATGRITVTIGGHTATSTSDIVIGNGVAWQDLGFTATISNYNQAATLGTKTIFAGGLKSNYIYLTTNGTTFTNVYNALPFNKTLLEIKLVAANDSAFYVTTNYGIAKSKDGSTWTKLTPNANSPDIGFTGIVAMGNTVNVINSNVLYTSTNGGTTWTTAVIAQLAGLDYITSDAAAKYWYAIDANGNLPNSNAKPFYRSTDKGKTWTATKAAAGYYLYGFGQQEFMKAHNNAVFVLYTPPSTSPSVADQRLYKSTNQGDAWTKVTDETVYTVKINGDEVMYGGLTFNLSKDGGSNFTKYLVPSGYTIYGAEKSNGYYYIFCTNNTTSAHKIFRAVIQ
ncbi:IPT/TIG domain-containing protein [Mucilaginibacter panaciglaebae]|uniref:IPT/TIG domain-containing protein n=1 Tax=Mucilaginibacter panaciglaebae TaxID=502331 RepID=A0ABP7WPK9_9SPHI